MRILRITFLILFILSSSLLSQTSYEKKGIFYLKSKFPCALNDYGSIERSNSCVRLVLFDYNSRVNVNEEMYSIELKNSQSYEEEALIFDLLVPGFCDTEDGKKRINIHYKIEKKGKKLNPQIHAHFTSRKKCKTAEMENYEILFRDGEKNSVLISKEDSSKAVLYPSLTSKFVKELVQVVDHLENVKVSTTSETDSKTIGDITIQVGKGKLSKNITNCKFTIIGNSPPSKNISSTLSETDWEIQLQSLTSFFPKTVLITELSLIGIDDPNLVQYIQANGLPKHESLIFQKTGSTGSLIWPKGRIEIKNYQDVVKSFFTGTFTGSIFLEKLETRK